MPADLDWGEVTPNQLQELLDSGKSYSEIASLFGVTRNKVSGQVYRWRGTGHMAPAQSRVMAGKEGKPLKRKMPKNLPFTLSGKTLQAPPPAAYRPPTRSKPKSLTPPDNPPVPLLELEADMCAYVVQEKPYLFCGCRPLANVRYRVCAYHEQGFFDRQPSVPGGRRRSKSSGRLQCN